MKEFPGQQEGEEVKLYLQRHWIFIGRIFIKVLMAFFVPAIYFGILSLFQISDKAFAIHLFFLFWYLIFFLLFFLIEFLNEELDIVIVTNIRLINIIQVHFFSRKSTEASLEYIQDIHHNTSGILPTLFNYGTINVQTAADQTKIILQDVSTPDMVTQQIMRLIEERKQKISPPVPTSEPPAQ